MTDISARARALAGKAMDTLEEVMEDGEAKDRIRAAEAILDRGYGKAAQAVIAIPAQRRAALAAANMTDQELRGVIDAEFEDVTAPKPQPVLANPRKLTDDTRIRTGGSSINCIEDPLLE